MKWKTCEECKKRYEDSDTCEEDEQLCFMLKKEAEKEIRKLRAGKKEKKIKFEENNNEPEIEIIEK